MFPVDETGESHGQQIYYLLPGSKYSLYFQAHYVTPLTIIDTELPGCYATTDLDLTNQTDPTTVNLECTAGPNP